MAVHYRPPFRSNLEALSFGWIGVDLFFVLSGFLITSSLLSLRDAANPFQVFYWRRALRIFPPYYLVLLPMVAVLLHEGDITRRFATMLFFFVTSLLNVHPRTLLHQLLTSGFHANLEHSLIDNHLFVHYQQALGVFWSLSIEELFYILWAPLVLRLPKRFVLAVSLFVIAISPLLRAVAHGPNWDEYYYLPTRCDGLVMGSILSLAFAASKVGTIQVASLRRWLIWLGIGSFVALLALGTYEGMFVGIEVRSTFSFAIFGYGLLAASFTAVVGLTVLGAEGSSLLPRMLRSEPLVYIGSISYMMYLTHLAVWVTVYKLLAGFRGHSFTPGLGMGFTAGVLTIALSGISRVIFELPILRYKDAHFALPRRVQARASAILHPSDNRRSRLES